MFLSERMISNISPTSPLTQEELDELWELARSTIENNMLTWRGKIYLPAGKFQYKSLWVRDAGYSASALAKLGRYDVIRNHIELYLDHVNMEGIGPKGFDTMWMENRAIISSTRQLFGMTRIPLHFDSEAPLKPLYQDSRSAKAVDSNLLVFLSVFELPESDKNELLEEDGPYFPILKRMVDFYDKITKQDGLIHQMPHSDWQDSQRRKGATFLTNLLYWRSCSLFIQHGRQVVTQERLDRLRDKLINVFMDTYSGVFRAVKDLEEQVSLDGNLLALRWDFLDQVASKKLWESLKRHPLWQGTACENPSARTDCFCMRNRHDKPEDTGYPGFATYPDYPFGHASKQVRFAGLQSYHDSLYWSWLMALSAEICYKMDNVDEGDRIAKKLLELGRRDEGFGECYTHTSEFPQFKTLLFESECPFSWGGAFVLDMVAERKRAVQTTK